MPTCVCTAYLSVCLSVCLSVYLCVCVCVSLSLSLCVSVYLSRSLCLVVSFSLDVTLTLYLPLSGLQAAAIAVAGGGSLSLANLAVPPTALATTLVGLSTAGSTLSLAAVTVPELPELGVLTGTVTVVAEGLSVLDPPDLFGTLPPFFNVLSGPCTVAVVDRHFCVGRWPGGYLPNEDCEIAVAWADGPIGLCPVFDTAYGDSLTLHDGIPH
eukprot:SAG22_NODE_2431_length_2580_cov_1.862555_3_plen_212_part_00